MSRVTLKEKISRKISRCWKRNVFTRKDFAELGGYDQVGRSLLQLERDGILIGMGYGLYAKARINSLTGKKMIACDEGFIGAAREALDLLGINWEVSEAERRYNNNLTTQIPINLGVTIKGRFNRKIRTEGGFQLRIS
ncbi:MAG: conjugal transfer protein [Gammaproteobacteria bacterium]